MPPPCAVLPRVTLSPSGHRSVEQSLSGRSSGEAVQGPYGRPEDRLKGQGFGSDREARDGLCGKSGCERPPSGCFGARGRCAEGVGGCPAWSGQREVSETRIWTPRGEALPPLRAGSAAGDSGGDGGHSPAIATGHLWEQPSRGWRGAVALESRPGAHGPSQKHVPDPHFLPPVGGEDARSIRGQVDSPERPHRCSPCSGPASQTGAQRRGWLPAGPRGPTPDTAQWRQCRRDGAVWGVGERAA